MKEEEGTYLLQFQFDEAIDMETEWFYHLQHALVRLTYLSQIHPDYLVACILFQARDGALFDVCEFNIRIGYGFETDRIPYATEL